MVSRWSPGCFADVTGARLPPASLGPVSGDPGDPAHSGGQSSAHPGDRLGLPAEGSGSVARFGRRLLALLVDWVVYLLVAAALGLGRVYGAPLVLLLEQTLLVGLLGNAIGHRLCGLAVVRLDGQPVGLGRGLLRAALLCLAVPAVVLDRDARGLHDLAAGTVVVRR